jgi:hypothetical protein
LVWVSLPPAFTPPEAAVSRPNYLPLLDQHTQQKHSRRTQGPCTCPDTLLVVSTRSFIAVFVTSGLDVLDPSISASLWQFVSPALTFFASIQILFFYGFSLRSVVFVGSF